MDIKGRTILVTGANSGLGAAVVARLAEGGAQVVGLDIGDDMAGAFAARFGDRVILLKGDVTSAGDCARAVETARGRFGGLRGAVNCAGVAPARSLLGKDGPHDLELFARIVAINLTGTFNILRLAAAAIAEEEPGEDGERGVIINTASVAAYEGQIGQTAYAASKGGVASLTLPAARELARNGIRVVAIAPGAFETPMIAAMPQQVKDGIGAKVPFPQRLGRPREYADLAATIFANTMLNGEVIRLDGALRMQPK